MTEQYKPDLSDILVRMQLNHSHMPDEQWENGKLQPMLCGMCDQPWPCAMRVELGINGEIISAFSFDGKEYGVYEKTGKPLMIVDDEVYEMSRVDEEEEDDGEQ